MKFNLKRFIFFLAILLFIALFFVISRNVNTFGFLAISSFYFYILISFLFIYYYYPHVEDKPVLNEKNPPEIGVVTYAYNDFKPVIHTISSLKKLKYPRAFTIYVITDGTCAFLDNIKGVKRIVIDKKYFSKDKNIKAEIMNQGLKEIHEDLLLCLDGDTVVNNNALYEMVPMISDNIAVVNTLLVPENKTRFLEKLQLFEYYINWGMALRVLSSMNSISIPVGGLFLLKNKVFKELGGYDVNNITEDRELGYRILEKGYNIKFVSSAKSSTEIPKSIAEWSKQRMRWARGEMQTIFKHRKFFFNKKLGLFGTFVLPFTFFLQTIGIAMAFGLLFKYLSRTFINTIVFLIECIKEGFFYFALPSHIYFKSTIYLVVVSTILFMIYSVNAFHLSNFKFEFKHIIPFIVFSTFYVFMVGMIYILAIFLEMINFKQMVFKRKT